MSNAWEKSPGNDDNHYKGTIQPTQFIEGKDMSFIEGCFVKYISRHKDKGGKLDLEKALWYIGRIIAKADGEDLVEEHSTRDFIESQKFSKLEAEIITKFMMFLVSGDACDLYPVRDLLQNLKNTEYGDC